MGSENGLQLFIKRLFDVIVASFGLIICSPLFIIISVLIWFEDFGPVFYKQKRVGLNGKAFYLIKFRSMKPNNISPSLLGQVGSDHPMVTKVGKVIRRYKIDELPQLLNVLTGDMSLVGPRPTLPDQVKEYSDYELMRLSVRPGITGWAQVNGNTNLSWGDRILLDRWYVNNWSLLLDFIILLKTCKVVVKGELPNMDVVREAAACEDSISRNRNKYSGSFRGDN